MINWQAHGYQKYLYALNIFIDILFAINLDIKGIQFLPLYLLSTDIKLVIHRKGIIMPFKLCI